MKTSKVLEVPRGLDDCTLTDITLLREWLSKACGTQKGLGDTLVSYLTSFQRKVGQVLSFNNKNESRDDQDISYEEAA